MSKKLLLAAILAGFVFTAGCSSQPAASSPVGIASGQPATSAAAMTGTPLPVKSPTPANTPVTGTSTPTPTPTIEIHPITASCGLAPVAAPTAAADPGGNELDPSTGLHMTGHPLTIAAAGYRLKVSGLVGHPLSLSLEELRCMPKVTVRENLVCPGYFLDIATWSGVPMRYILELAGTTSAAKVITLVAADGYKIQVRVEDGLGDRVILAYEWNGEPLPILHGFPVRAVFPSMYGSKWIKWLVEIKLE
jgi:DMSO/TMAO reductase YedYZ molybdopterin-dependent catalytic subunit